MQVNCIIEDIKRKVSIQTGRGYYASMWAGEDESFIGFKHNDEIYIISAKNKLRKENELLYNTATKTTSKRESITSDGGSVRKNTTEWHWEDVTNIPELMSIVAHKLQCTMDDIEIVEITVVSSNKLADSHAKWKRFGYLPYISNACIYDMNDNRYRIYSPCPWPLPKHVLDRCKITKINKYQTEEIVESQVGYSTVEMI